MYTFCESIYSFYCNNYNNYKNQRQFKQKLRINRKKVVDTNIIGMMTLFEAKLKVDHVQIWLCEIDGKELDIVQVGMTNRVVVVVQNDVITQLISFG